MKPVSNGSRAYLEEQLKGVIGNEAVPTTVEFLLSLGQSSCREEMIVFLETSFGPDSRFVDIVDGFLLSLSSSSPSSPPFVSPSTDAESRSSRSSSTSFSPGRLHFKENSETKAKHAKANSTRIKSDDDRTSASKICGCMATNHPCYVNCISCGRIHCEKENGSPGCLFCGAPLITPVSIEAFSFNGASDFDKHREIAYQQKDKLLKFDKEVAKRTAVLDAQGDYYDTATWLSEDEKQAIDNAEKIRRDKNKRRPKSSVSVKFDVAGRKTVRYFDNDVENDVDELRENDAELSDAYSESFDLENLSFGQSSSRAFGMYKSLRERISNGTI